MKESGCIVGVFTAEESKHGGHAPDLAEYPPGSVTGTPTENPHVVNVPAGGTAIAEMKLEVPRRYILADRALSRVERGLAGWPDVEGEENPDIVIAIS